MADNYAVTGQRTTVDPKPDGTVANVVEITFKTKPSGVVSTARVDEEFYNAVDVDRILTEKAATIEAVHSL